MTDVVRQVVAAGVLTSACCLAMGQRVLHVAAAGDDANPGTRERPLATLTGARDAIRAMSRSGGLPDGGVRVRLAGGLYRLAEPLILTPADGGTKTRPIVYEAAAGQRPILSGGRPVTGWKRARREALANLWTVELPDVKAGRWYFRQLFADGRRLRRARLPNDGHFKTAGPLSKFAERARGRWGGYRGTRNLRREHPDAYCGFAYRRGDIKDWSDGSNAEILTFHSWECSWQTIRAVDEANSEVHLNTPCRYPIGFFSNHCRYRVENVRAALDAPGEWMLDRKTGVLSYLARAGQDPSKMSFVAPAIERLIVLAGEAKSKRFIEHVTLRGLSLRHAQYPMGIYDVAPDWPKPALAVLPDWPETFPPGYTDAQAATRCGQAVELRDARHCTLDRCEITLVGSSGVKLFERCSHNRIVGCHIHDVGGGGVLIGMPVRATGPRGIPPTDAPSHNVVEDNRLERLSLVHPSAVGVWVAQSHHNRLSNNEISDVGYAGVHLGWTWGRSENYTGDNLIEYNHIHHVMRDLADAAGIYSLGVQDGTVYRGNYIHDIARAAGAVGAPVDGLFFDQGSKGIRVERNVIRTCGHAAYRFNQCRKEDMAWSDNDFAVDDRPVRHGDVVRRAGPRKR